MNIKKSWIVKTAIAHRGLHNADFPENSLGAFENAVKNNYPIELDIRSIDDGTVIVFHDDVLTRLTNSDGYACNLKKEDLESLRLFGTEYKIPTLEQVLENVNGQTPLLIEIKNSNKVGALEKKTIDMLRHYEGEVAIQSFNPYSLDYFKHNAPQYMRGQLSTFFTKEQVPSFLKRYLMKRLKMNHVSKPDFIAYEGKFLPNLYVSKTNLPVLAWTICDNAEMEAVLPYCDNIIFEKFIPQMTPITKDLPKD